MSATAFYKEQSVLDFFSEIVSVSGVSWEVIGGGDRGYRDGQGRAGGGFEPSIPSSFSDSERRQFAKEIKG